MENYKKIVDDYFNQKFEEFNLSTEIKSIDDLVEISENVVNMGINIKDNFEKDLNINENSKNYKEIVDYLALLLREVIKTN
ncbi:hypothetical protein [Empedobacter brevis]|uniref:hypothetical protein n=1 Tax=Empedobacter brevis TaxID=247 RepID=UPI003340C1C6